MPVPSERVRTATCEAFAGGPVAPSGTRKAPKFEDVSNAILYKTIDGVSAILETFIKYEKFRR